MCVCKNKCGRYMADCAETSHPGWFCYRCSIEIISKELDMSEKEVQGKYELGLIELNDNREIIYN